MARAGLWAAALVAAALAGAPGPAPAQAMLEGEAARAVAAVGRLNVAGNRHCTATLIAPDEVLTAAHCLHNPRTGRRAPPEELRFVAGLRPGGHAALRGVRAVAVAEGYVFSAAPGLADVGRDLALLVLDAPIAVEAVAPLPLAVLADRTLVDIVAYGRERAWAASLRAACPVLQREAALIVVGCPVTAGVSGAPVLAGEGAARGVVAVVSARGGRSVALAVPAGAAVDRLRAVLAAGGP